MRSNLRECAFCGAMLRQDLPPVDPDFEELAKAQKSPIFRFIVWAFGAVLVVAVVGSILLNFSVIFQ